MKKALSLLSLIIVSFLVVSACMEKSDFNSQHNRESAMPKSTPLPCTKMMTQQVQANNLIVSWKTISMPFMTQ
jgi:hypothetical protein